MSNANNKESMEGRLEHPKALVVTALPLEFNAARAFLTGEQEVVQQCGRVDVRGQFASDKSSWEVLLVQCGVGNTKAALETHKAMEAFKPDVAIFVGVAGGIKDVAMADVVVAETVYGYEGGKEDTEFKPRPKARDSSYQILECAKAEARKKDWQRRINETIGQNEPKVVIGSIASGEKIVANSDSPSYRQIRAFYNDAIAVEMEGKGFLDATSQYKAVESLVVRGISDLIDRKTESDSAGSQPIAAHHACAFAFQVLSCFHIEPPNNCPSDKVKDGEPSPCFSVAEIRSAFIEESLGQELAESKDLLRQHKDDEAFVILERLRQRQWLDLNDEQKRTVLTNLANIHVKRGDYVTSAERMIEAAPYGPDDEGTQANLIVAYDLQGNRAKAAELAKQLTKRFPESEPVWANYIYTFMGSASSEELREEVPESLRDHNHILELLAYRAFLREEPEKGAILAAKACEADPKDGFGWFLQGACALEIARGYLSPPEYKPMAEKSRELLESSDRYLTKAIEIGEELKDKRILIESYHKRSVVRKVLDRKNEAHNDRMQFWYLAPDCPITYIEKSEQAFSNNDLVEAERLLRIALDKNADNKRAIGALAGILSQQGGEKAIEASRLLQRLLVDPSLPFDLRIEVAYASIRLHAKADTLDQLSKTCEEILEREPQGIYPHLLAGMVGLQQGKTGEAESHAKKAHERVGRDTPTLILRCVAKLLMDLQRHEAALDLWQRVAAEGNRLEDQKALIDCANSLGKHDLILETCERIRSSGYWEDQLVQFEFSLLQQYDPLHAADILKERISSHPDEFLPRALLSFLGVQLRRDDLLVLKPQYVPDPGGVEVQMGCIAAQALRACGFPNEGLDFLYRLLRLHYSDPEARRCYIQFLLFPMVVAGSKSVLSDPGIVGTDCAVSYREDGYADDRWVVIEGTDSPRTELNEYAPNHPLAKKLQGQRVGDEVILETAPLVCKATIRSIVSKHVYRFRVLLEDEQRAHPDKPFLWAINVKRPGMGEEEYDFGPLFEMMRGEWKKEQNTKELYSRVGVPVRILRGENFQSVDAAASDPDIRLRVCGGHPSERRYAVELVRGSDPIVVDHTALATIWLLDWDSVFDLLRGRLCMGPLSRQALETFLASHCESDGALVPTAKGAAIISRDEQTQEAFRKKVKRFLRYLEENITLTRASELSAMDAAARDKLVFVLGRDGAEAVTIASRPKHILWTDDNIVSILASRLSPYEHRRIWTDAVSEAMGANGKITPEDRLVHAAKLLGWGYTFTPLNADILVKLCDLGEWRASCGLLRPAFEQIASPGTIETMLPGIISQFFARIYARPLPSFSRDLLMSGFLDAITQRPNGLSLVWTIRKLVRPTFGMNVIAAGQAIAMINTWLAVRSQGGSTKLALPMTGL